MAAIAAAGTVSIGLVQQYFVPAGAAGSTAEAPQIVVLIRYFEVLLGTVVAAAAVAVVVAAVAEVSPALAVVVPRLAE